MTYEAEWEETGDYCPQCSGAIRVKDCEICGGDGEVDLYEEDAINFAPGETEYCEDCSGHGYHEWCPKCGDIIRITCPTCDGQAYVLDPNGNGIDDYLSCPDCDGERILLKVIPFPASNPLSKTVGEVLTEIYDLNPDFFNSNQCDS